MNEEARAVVDGLDQALADSGLTQAEFAAALGTSASRFSTYRSGKTMPSAAFYLRALRLAANLNVARVQGWMTPQTAAAEIRKSLQRQDELRALKMALQARDHLRSLLRDCHAAGDAWTSAPRPTGDRKWDALLAALTEHEFAEAHREPPKWTRTTADRGDPLFIRSLLLAEDEVRAATPPWLAAHGVYAAERDLVTA